MLRKRSNWNYNRYVLKFVR